jgi:hypothetical protein
MALEYYAFMSERDQKFMQSKKEDVKTVFIGPLINRLTKKYYFYLLGEYEDGTYFLE